MKVFAGEKTEIYPTKLINEGHGEGRGDRIGGGDVIKTTCDTTNQFVTDTNKYKYQHNFLIFGTSPR